MVEKQQFPLKGTSARTFHFTVLSDISSHIRNNTIYIGFVQKKKKTLRALYGNV